MHYLQSILFPCLIFFFVSAWADELKEVSETSEPEQESFAVWFESLKSEALVLGVSQDTVNTYLTGIELIPRVVEKDRAQPEFKESIAEYLEKRVTDWRIENGKAYLIKHKDTLETIAAEYKVQARFIVAIIGIESNFGTYKLPYSALNVLVTLAYDPRRGERFRKEVFAVLQMLDENLVDETQLKSSWAGALGAPQFMPTTFLRFAVDYDKDGKKDIWSHGPDLYASVANYLSFYGWHDDETWSRKVMLPEGKIKELEADVENRVTLDAACDRYSEHLRGWRNLDDWNALGVRRMTGSDLPSRKIPAALIVTQEDYHHGYLVYRNFCTLMRYNPSFKYAMSVGVLADSIQ